MFIVGIAFSTAYCCELENNNIALETRSFEPIAMFLQKTYPEKVQKFGTVEEGRDVTT
jgi:hypothetical protein